MRFTTDDLNDMVLQVILTAQPTIDDRISKKQIALKVYGKYDLNIDRKIRDAMTELAINGYPICATSDNPGYYLARSYDEAEQCINELRSRADVLSQKIDGIKRGLMNAKQPIRETVQMSVFGGWSEPL